MALKVTKAKVISLRSFCSKRSHHASKARQAGRVDDEMPLEASTAYGALPTLPVNVGKEWLGAGRLPPILGP